MPLSNPFRRTADCPSLRGRAAALRASFRPTAPAAAPVTAILPAPGSPEAMAAFHEACRQHSARTAHLHDCPELMRDGRGVWSTQSLMQSLEAGEIEADEYARLHTFASARELRFAEVAHELNIGALFALAYASEYPVPPAPDSENRDDADLLRLGHQFEAARSREMAACEACNAATKEARNHMPERPAALRYRASDHAMYLHKHYTSPEYLDGREITSDDVEWVSRKRHTRDVRRPVRPEDKLPADAKFVAGHEPWPEAQARADEIVAAWKAWHADRNAVYAAHDLPRLEETADKAGDATAALAERLAAIPAHTADGFRLKLRALAFYRRSVLDAELEDEADPDHILSHSLWRDVQGEVKAVEPSEHSLIPAIYEEWAAWGLVSETAGTEDEDTAAWERADVQRDRLLHAAMALPASLDNIAAKALACAWMEWVCVEKPGKPREAYGPADQLVFDIHSTIMGREAAPASTRPLGLLRSVGIDLKALPLADLAALHSSAELLTEVAAAITCQPRSMTGDHFSPSGRVVDHVHNDLCDVLAETEAEIRSRKTFDRVENETRLAALATSTIHNDDWDQITVLAREMLAHAEAERTKG